MSQDKRVVVADDWDMRLDLSVMDDMIPDPCRPDFEQPAPSKHPRRAKSTHKQNARKTRKARK